MREIVRRKHSLAFWWITVSIVCFASGFMAGVAVCAWA